MAFEWFPFLEGRYLSYSDYLTLTGTFIMILNYMFWVTILKVYRVYLERQSQQEDKDMFDDDAFKNELYSSFDDQPSESVLLYHQYSRGSQRKSQDKMDVEVSYVEETQSKTREFEGQDLTRPLLGHDVSTKEVTQKRTTLKNQDMSKFRNNQQQNPKSQLRDISTFKQLRLQSSLSRRSISPNQRMRTNTMNKLLNDTQPSNRIQARYGTLYLFVQWVATVSFALILIPVHGLRYKSEFTTILLIAFILIRRYFQNIYMRYKFILFDIEIFDLQPSNNPQPQSITNQLRQTYTLYQSNVDSPSASLIAINQVKPQQNITQSKDKGFFGGLKQKLTNYKQVLNYYFQIQPLWFGLSLLIIIGSSILIARSTSDLCIQKYQFTEQSGGLPFIGGVQISSKEYRTALYQESCEIGELCHAYLTHSTQFDKEILNNHLSYTLHFHIAEGSCVKDICDPYVQIDEINGKQQIHFKAEEIQYSNSYQTKKRKVYQAKVRELQSGQNYIVSIKLRNQIYNKDEYQFSLQTPQLNQDQEIVFVHQNTNQAQYLNLVSKIMGQSSSLLIFGQVLIFLQFFIEEITFKTLVFLNATNFGIISWIDQNILPPN
eukprot:403375669